MAGNAAITLLYNGKSTVFEVWLTMINTSSNTEFYAQQIRDGMSWIPIRRAERFFNFQAVWPLISTQSTSKKPDLGFEDIDPSDGFAKMNKFQDAIRSHQISIVNGSTTRPMYVDYYNNSDPTLPIYNTMISQKPLPPLKFTGWIKVVEKQYVRFQNLFVTNYTMNILTPNIAGTPPTAMDQSANITYAPTAAEQARYGDSWINTRLAAARANNLQGLPN